jgi:hypothetical protein
MACEPGAVLAACRFTAKATVARPDALEAYFSSYRDKQALAVKAGPAPGGTQVREYWHKVEATLPSVAHRKMAGNGCMCSLTRWLGELWTCLLSRACLTIIYDRR